MTHLTDTQRETLEQVLASHRFEWGYDRCACGWLPQGHSDHLGQHRSHAAAKLYAAVDAIIAPYAEALTRVEVLTAEWDRPGAPFGPRLAAHIRAAAALVPAHEHRLGANCWCGWSGFETPADEAAALATTPEDA